MGATRASRESPCVIAVSLPISAAGPRRQSPPDGGNNLVAVPLYLKEEDTMGRGLLLWLLGVPIPVILLLWLFFR